MRRACLARIANPSLTLLAALKIGGFTFQQQESPTCEDFDDDGVRLRQRKSQLCASMVRLSSVFSSPFSRLIVVQALRVPMFCGLLTFYSALLDFLTRLPVRVYVFLSVVIPCKSVNVPATNPSRKGCRGRGWGLRWHEKEVSWKKEGKEGISAKRKKMSGGGTEADLDREAASDLVRLASVKDDANHTGASGGRKGKNRGNSSPDTDRDDNDDDHSEAPCDPRGCWKYGWRRLLCSVPLCTTRQH